VSILKNGMKVMLQSGSIKISCPDVNGSSSVPYGRMPSKLGSEYWKSNMECWNTSERMSGCGCRTCCQSFNISRWTG
jgi:hypothetical protein